MEDIYEGQTYIGFIYICLHICLYIYMSAYIGIYIAALYTGQDAIPVQKGLANEHANTRNFSDALTNSFIVKI